MLLNFFVVVGLDIDLSPCAVCGRNFATDRLAKHQKACKKVSKPRKQFNVTAMRLAGSGAEKYQSKKHKAPEKKVRIFSCVVPVTCQLPHTQIF